MWLYFILYPLEIAFIYITSYVIYPKSYFQKSITKHLCITLFFSNFAP